VVLARTDVSEERVASIISVKGFSDLLVIPYIVPSSLILSTLMMEAIPSSEMSFLTRATLRHIPQDDIPHRQLCENLKSVVLVFFRDPSTIPVLACSGHI
jgi:hypothetical protein